MAAPLGVLAGVIVPHPGEHGIPLCVSVQFTPLLLASFATVAVNCCVAFTLTLALDGETVTPIGGATVTVAAANFVVSATEVAVTVTCAGLALQTVLYKSWLRRSPCLSDRSFRNPASRVSRSASASNSHPCCSDHLSPSR